MISCYDVTKEIEDTKKQRKKVLTVFIIITAVYVVLSVLAVIWNCFLPYKSKTQNVIKCIEYPLTAVYVVFAFLFLSIPFKRVNRYYKTMLNFRDGTKDTYEGMFFEFNPSLETKDGIDCKSLIFLEWNKYREEYFERKVLYLYEKEFPVFKENQIIKFVTSSNILLGYEIIEEIKIK